MNTARSHEMTLLIPRWDKNNPAHAALLRRIDGCAARRHAAAMPPGEVPIPLEVWKRERDRGDKLRGWLIAWLAGEEPITRIPGSPVMRMEGERTLNAELRTSNFERTP